MARLRIGALILLAAAAVGCAVNPVTGQKELMLYSESQEIELGRQTDAEVAAAYGVYDDPALAAYVTRIGAGLAAKGQRPNLPWRFTVLDSPVVNAFAVPGGAVYVTRGILALMNSEAELAAVLGHEIGHVNARHSMSQMSKQQVAQIGLVVGSTISQEFAKYAGLAGTGLQVLFLKYSRDAENQADALGVDYARADGYDPADMAATFAALQKMGDLAGGNSLPGFLSTHPLTPDRIAHVQSLLRPGDASLARRPDVYLKTVDNLVFGEDPRQGYVENGVFYHPALRFQFAVPARWTVDNSPSRVTLIAADKNAGIVLQGGRTSDTAEEFARKQAAEITKSGGKLVEEGRTTVNGLAGYQQAYTIPQENAATLRMALSYLKKGDWVFAISAMSPDASYGTYAPEFRKLVASFKDLTDASKINRSPRRLAVVKANGTDSLQAIFKKSGVPQASWPQLAIMNGRDLAAVPPAGAPVKTLR